MNKTIFSKIANMNMMADIDIDVPEPAVPLFNRLHTLTNWHRRMAGLRLFVWGFWLALVLIGWFPEYRIVLIIASAAVIWGLIAGDILMGRAIQRCVRDIGNVLTSPKEDL